MNTVCVLLAVIGRNDLCEEFQAKVMLAKLLKHCYNYYHYGLFRVIV